MAGGIKRFVLDTSVTLAGCFDDEKTQFTESVFDLLAGGAEALVPAIWPAEVANAFLSAERSKRIKVADVTVFLTKLASLTITVEAPRIQSVFGSVVGHARSQKLTAYDATYLDLAAREGVPLATLDRDLRRAAVALGVALLSLT